MLDCMKKTIQKEGVRGLYKGMSAPIAGTIGFTFNYILQVLLMLVQTISDRRCSANIRNKFLRVWGREETASAGWRATDQFKTVSCRCILGNFHNFGNGTGRTNQVPFTGPARRRRAEVQRNDWLHQAVVQRRWNQKHLQGIISDTITRWVYKVSLFIRIDMQVTTSHWTFDYCQ